MTTSRRFVGRQRRKLLSPAWALVAAVAVAAAVVGPAAAQSPGPAAMETDRYTVLDYDNGGLLMRSVGFNRTVRAEVTPSQCETVVRNSVVEVLVDTAGFGFWVENTFCRITRVEDR